MTRSRAAVAGAAWLALAHPAEAHIVGSRLGDFYAGAQHPLTTVEDVLLWLAIGLLAGTQQGASARLLVLLFPAGLLLGLLTGLGITPIGSQLADAVMMAALGGMLALGRKLPEWLIGGVAVLLAFLRGLANAAGAVPGTNRVLFAAGFVLAGYATITLAMGAAAAFRRAEFGWRAIAVRATGSWIAAIGIMFGSYALAVR